MMYYIKFGDPATNRITDVKDTVFILCPVKMQKQVKVTYMLYEALSHRMMYYHVKFGYPTTNSITDMLWTMFSFDVL